ncbi:MAG: aldehyde ferredoxin oxidoreductase family protein [Candidatus Odinarchaeota archaeon]|nr:aldehyde ferredoxin oxidoreductase family protein [Candidatus Odinarchaeota archaeon]
MISGYANTVLYVDLTEKKIEKKPLDKDLVMRFVGGRGFGAKLLYDLNKPGIDPFSPENHIIVATGPFTGVYVPKSTKYAFITKSPLTGAYLDTFSGGHFGPELKFAGYDIIIIKGASDKPVYLWINDDEVKLLDASHLWGKPVKEVDEIIKKDHFDRNIKVAAIGPAGENLVRFACITNDLFRQAARGGAGAVLGSKKLKAIAVRGSKDIKIHDPKKFLELADEAFKKTMQSPARNKLLENTTLLQTLDSNEWGVLPTRNYQTTYFEHAHVFSGKYLNEKGIKLKNRACFGCPIACSGVNVVKSEKYGTIIIEGPEYESATLLGSNCGVSDFDAVAKANELCDFLGIDAISAGNVIAFAMELYERGIITKEDTDGIELTFGNGEALVEMIKKIAYREGFGDILAEGTKRAAQKIGKGAERYAVNVKGMELPAYDPRSTPGMALAYVTNDIGGAHNRAWTMYVEIFNPDYERYSIKKKPQLVIDSQRSRTLPDIMGYCRFILLSYDEYAALYTALTGIEVTGDDLVEVTDRVYTLTRLFNTREGFTRDDDSLPPRMYDPIQTGPQKGVALKPEDIEKMKDEYYKLRGWDRDGIPLRETLEKLKLSEYIGDLEKLRKKVKK